MKRLTQCIIAMLLVGCILIMPVYAAENQVDRSSEFFIKDSAYLSKVSSTEFNVWFSVTAVKGMDELGVSAIYVDESPDGSDWTELETYTNSDYPELLDYETGYHGGHVSCSGRKGYYYRALVVFYAKDGRNIGEMPIYTYSIQL
ncbi:MAG: hypothetical protein Q4F17_01040 [Eubacteriales bacterium]|nr:hypothetical protein [Eubacteriales bacterium]